MIDWADVMAILTLEGWDKSYGIGEEIKRVSSQKKQIIHIPESYI